MRVYTFVSLCIFLITEFLFCFIFNATNEKCPTTKRVSQKIELKNSNECRTLKMMP